MRWWGLGIGVICWTATAGAAPVQRFAIVQEIARDTNAPSARQDEFLDSTFYVVWPRQHLTMTFGSFASGAEWGGYVRDRRGSTYEAALRRRQGGWLSDTALDLGTEQRFARLVWGGAVRAFWPDSPETSNLLFVPSGGVQMYYRGESFASLRVVHDPRPDTGTTLRFANRWTRGRNFLEATIAPRTDGVVNWSMQARWGYALFGYGHERDFDFSRLDRHVWSFGFQYDFPTAP
jgi:hypothetical protein